MTAVEQPVRDWGRIVPSASFIRPDNQPFSVHLFGRIAPDGTNQSWLKKRGGRDRLGLYLDAEYPNVANVFAPNPALGNAVCVGATPEHFGDTEVLSSGAVLHDEVKADGVLALPTNSAYWCPSAGCPVVVLSDGEQVSATHAGARSLGVRGDYFGDEAESVLETMMDNFRFPERVWAYVHCGKGPLSFPHSDNHSEWGPQNREMKAFIADRWGNQCVPVDEKGVQHLALYEVVKAQLKKRHVNPDQVISDHIDVTTDQEGGKFAWHDYSRGSGRNGVLVVREE